jgi:hypothetical protein
MVSKAARRVDPPPSRAAVELWTFELDAVSVSTSPGLARERSYDETPIEELRPATSSGTSTLL